MAILVCTVVSLQWSLKVTKRTEFASLVSQQPFIPTNRTSAGYVHCLCQLYIAASAHVVRVYRFRNVGSSMIAISPSTGQPPAPVLQWIITADADVTRTGTCGSGEATESQGEQEEQEE